MLPLESKEASEKDERDNRSEVVVVHDDFNVFGIRYNCNDSPCPTLVLLYARLGLHRYNFLQGKDLQLSSVKIYITSSGDGAPYRIRYVTAAQAYSMTLEAMDPSATSLQTFQARVNELSYGKFILTCSIARPLVETKKSIITSGKIKRSVLNNKCLGEFMPELPLENPFKDDSTDRFYVLKKSEVQKNDWIRLYLELAVATTNRHHIKHHGVSNLIILKVSMEITRDLEPFNKGLDAYDAIFYIRYKDSCKARVGEDVDRVAIVRRILDEQSEILRLVGRTQSSQTLVPSNGSSSIEVGSSSTQELI